MTYMINLGFGFVRARTKKLSLSWFLCIHLPIPFIYIARVSSKVDFIYVPLFVVAAILGQIMGSRMEL